MRFLNKLKEEVMAKAKKSEVIFPDAPELPADSVPEAISTFNAEARTAALAAKPCVTCGTAVAPGEVCAVDGQKAE